MIDASFLIEWVKNKTEARKNTTSIYTEINAIFFLFLRKREESVKSRMFLCRSIHLLIELP
jgi:hypothetical protein